MKLGTVGELRLSAKPLAIGQYDIKTYDWRLAEKNSYRGVGFKNSSSQPTLGRYLLTLPINQEYLGFPK